VLGALSIGVFILPVALLATALLLRRRRDLRSATGALSGLGVPLLLVAGLNRSGPGTVCTELADGARKCEEQMSPWPWLVAAVLFVLLGVAAYVLLGERRRGPRCAKWTDNR
jgi:membrane protease YdiL (CAAX protease family)